METGTHDSVFAFRGYRLDPRQRRLWNPDGEPVSLRPKEFDALLVLVTRAGAPVAKDELMVQVWPGAVVEENNLNQVISRLRQILGDDRHDPVFIATITGRGYQFVATVDSVGAGDRGDIGPAVESPTRPRRRWAMAAVVLAVAGILALGLLQNGESPAPAAPAGLSDAMLVTVSPASNSTPALSPDGTIMAFISDRSGVDQVWVKGVPDGRAIQLTDGPLPASSPSWSPVSNAILFQRADADGVQSVWLVDALGSEPPRLVLRDAARPRFAPDGQSFVFTRGLGEIHIGFLDGGRTRKLSGVPETPGFAHAMPAMNAAGDIAFVLADEGPSGNLWLYEASTGEFRQLTRSNTEFAGVWASSPAWLPDNRTIIYTASTDEPANSHLMRVDIRTGESVRLSAGVGGYREPALSGDGSRLAYVYTQPLRRLVRTDPRTGEHRTLYESRKTIALPAVSPDGRSIVHFGEAVYTLPVDGGEVKQLTFGAPGQATLPAWSRSDDTIYYYRGRTLHRLDPESGLDEPVLEDFHWSKQHWLAAHGNVLAYRIRSRWPGRARSVVHDLDSGDIRTFDDDILPTDWSRDGKTLLGRRLGDYALLTCQLETLACKPIRDGDAEIGGARPRWSHDETRVFFRRALSDKPGYADIWVVSREGGQPERLFELGQYEPLNFFFGIAHDDTVIWPQFDSRGNPEIWMTQDLGAGTD